MINQEFTQEQIKEAVRLNEEEGEGATMIAEYLGLTVEEVNRLFFQLNGY